MDRETRRRPGRPAKHPPGERRLTLTFRVREPTHEKLKQAAASAGRSISEEIEHRVERSFEHEYLDRLEGILEAFENVARAQRYIKKEIIEEALAEEGIRVEVDPDDWVEEL